MKKLALLLIAFAMAVTMNLGAFAKDTQKDASTTTEVKSYTKKDGTVVKGYTRTKKSADATDTVKVKGYTKADGTKVESYTRKKATKSTSK